MKTLFNIRFSKISLGLFLAVFFALPAFSASASLLPISVPSTSANLVANASSGSSSVSAATQGSLDASFCSAFAGFSSSTLSKVAEAKSIAEANKAKVNIELLRRQSQNDSGLSAARASEDSAMNALFTSVEASAVTKSQKAAVKEFEKAVSDSVDIRKNTVDAAVAEYRTGLKAALSDEQQAVSAALSDFQSSVEASMGSAKNNCQAAALPAANLRSLAKSGLKDAKAKLAEKSAVAADAKAALNSLVSKRKKAILHADQDFHGALNAAKNTLKKSFPDAMKGARSSAAAAATSSLLR